MARPGICILCLADTCAYYVHPVFNPAAPYGYLLPTMYLFMAYIANLDLFVCGCDEDIICVGHDLNRCSGWWYVCSVNVE